MSDLVLGLDEENIKLSKCRRSIDALLAQVGKAYLLDDSISPVEKQYWRDEIQNKLREIKEIFLRVNTIQNAYRCLLCNAGIADGSNYCPVCGNMVEWDKIKSADEKIITDDQICPKCGCKLEDDAAFCIKCGTKVDRLMLYLKSWEFGMW